MLSCHDTTREEQVKLVLAHIKQFEVDRIIVASWARTVPLNFFARFAIFENRRKQDLAARVNMYKSTTTFV